MTKDQNLPVKVIGAPTVREGDGLAMSSRNAYLSTAEREIAGKLPETLTVLCEKAHAGNNLRHLEKEGEAALIVAGFDTLDYIEFREGDTLELSQEISSITRIFAAGHIGKTRLIDNMPALKP